MNDPRNSLLNNSDTPIDSGSGLPIPPAGAQVDEDDSFSEGVDHAIRKEHANTQDETSEPKYRGARICVFLIMVVWVWAGFTKVMDMSKFVGIVDQHRVIPEHLQDLVWWVGPGEIVLGLLLVFVMGSELRKPFGKFVLLVSAVSIGGFIYYISLVDPVVLQESGCGCLGQSRIASGIKGNERFSMYGLNVVLLILHLVALFGPAMVDSRRRTD